MTNPKPQEGTKRDNDEYDLLEAWPESYNECLYCGEPVKAPAMFCCEEHEEGRGIE